MNNLWTGSVQPGGSQRGGFGQRPVAVFDGGSGYVNIPSFTLGGTGDVTISVWAYSADFSTISGGVLVCKEPVNGDWMLFVEGGTLKLRGGSTTLIFYTINLSGLHYFSGTIQGTTGKLYIDGELVATGTVAATTGTTNTLSIGRFVGGYNFPGIIAEAVVLPFAATAQQISELYNLTIDPVSLAPAGYWKLTEGDGLVAYDLSGNGNNGTITGGVAWEEDDAAPYFGAASGGSLAFNGTTGYLTGSDAGLPAGFSSLSISIRFRTAPGYAPTAGTLIAYGTAATDEAVLIGVGNVGGGFGVWFSQYGIETTYPTAFNDGNWHHVLCIINGGSPGNAEVVIFFDGNATPSSLSGQTINLVLGGTLYVAHDMLGDFFQGNISEIAIWNNNPFATVDQIAGLASGVISPLSLAGASNLIRYWKCDLGSGTTETDIVSGQVLTLTGGTTWSKWRAPVFRSQGRWTGSVQPQSYFALMGTPVVYPAAWLMMLIQ